MSASPLAIELRGIPNPFRSGITRDAWDPDWVDVPEIHAAASARICREVTRARDGGGCGILVFGEPGSGKTHLLNRVRRWCLEEGALFAGFRLQCGPQTLWRHMRREFARSLLRRLPDGGTQMDRLAAAAYANAKEPEDYSLARVLERWREGRFLHECAAWLRGERLPEEALRALGIADTDAEEEEAAEDDARRILRELIALAAPAPVLLALDQVEALQADPQDVRGLAAIGSAAAALRDEIPNLVLTTCVQTSFLPRLHEAVLRADMDRMGEVRLELLPLEEPQAEAILAARLDAEPAMRDHRLRREQPLWPFTSYAVRYLLMKGSRVTPRRLIAEAYTLFEQLRGEKPPAVPRPETFLRAKLRARIGQSSEAQPVEGNEFLLDGLRRVLPLMGWRSVEPRPKGIDLLVEKEGRRRAVAVFNRARMHGAAQRLRKIRETVLAETVRLVRAAAVPVSASAVKTLEELAKLEEEGAKLVRVSNEALAALEACRTLLSDAAAGDLHKDGETLGLEFVEQWLQENLPEELRELEEGLESGAGGASRLSDELAELVREVKVISVEEAAARLGAGVEEVRLCADQSEAVVAAVGMPAKVLIERRSE
jgi:hypothetical protein